MIEILGVKIDSLTINEALEKARGFLKSKKNYLIFTPNPEMIVDAQHDSYFKEVLNSSNLSISDGFGVTFISMGKVKRVTGVDFLLKLCELAQMENKSVYLLGSSSMDVLLKTKNNLLRQFPKLKIAGLNRGPKIDFLTVENKKIIIPDSDANDEAIHDIIMTAPDILFVAFGHNKQEKWIYENIKNLPTVKVAMGVGGAFDFISGSVGRAPCFLRKIGLEWLYRLFKQPWRIGRIFKATAVFVSLVIYKKIKKI